MAQTQGTGGASDPPRTPTDKIISTPKTPQAPSRTVQESESESPCERAAARRQARHGRVDSTVQGPPSTPANRWSEMMADSDSESEYVERELRSEDDTEAAGGSTSPVDTATATASSATQETGDESYDADREDGHEGEGDGTSPPAGEE